MTAPQGFALAHRGVAFLLAEGPGIAICRDPDCDVAFPNDPRVSRKHARFTLEGGAVFVADLGRCFIRAAEKTREPAWLERLC